MTSSYLLDTSALGNHYLGAAGDRFVADCIRKGADVCALTVFEFGILLKRHGVPEDELRQTWAIYRQTLTCVHPVDEAVAELALRLRLQAAGRLPLADACIAACAAHHALTLLHADDHFAILPASITTVDIRKV